MKSTIFMIVMVLKYLLISLPGYQISVSLWKSEGVNTHLPAKRLLAMEKAGIIAETILFAAACFIFMLKCFGGLPWW